MKTKHALLIALLAGLLLGANLHAQIFVANENKNTITKYNLDGTPVGTGTLVSGNGLEDPDGIAISGSDILVADAGNTILEYTTAGSLVATLVSGTANG